MFSKEKIIQDMQSFRCDISALQRMAENIQKRVDRLPDEPKAHRWEVGEWFSYEYTDGSTGEFAVHSIKLMNSRTVIWTSNDTLCDVDRCTPIPTPHEIGTWIRYGDVSFKIEKREWLTALNDWFYQDDTHSLCGKTATAIPTPLFEIGETVKHLVLAQFNGIISERGWERDGAKEVWTYKINDRWASESQLRRVPDHEWKVGDWAYNKKANHAFIIATISPFGNLRDSVDSIYEHFASACIPVHFIQTSESTIGEQCRVITPEGWIGIVTYVERNGMPFDNSRNIRVINPFKEHYGWYSAAELTLCAPEGTQK